MGDVEEEDVAKEEAALAQLRWENGAGVGGRAAVGKAWQ